MSPPLISACSGLMYAGVPIICRCGVSTVCSAIDAVVAGWKRSLADILAATVPRFAIANTFHPGALSSDLAVEEAYRADPIAVHRTTTRLGASLFREQDRVKRVLAGDAQLPVTTYVLHGADDPIVPEGASRSLEGRANVTRRVYQGLHHETHNEPTGAAVIDDTIAWIVRRVAERSAAIGLRP